MHGCTVQSHLTSAYAWVSIVGFQTTLSCRLSADEIRSQFSDLNGRATGEVVGGFLALGDDASELPDYVQGEDFEGAPVGEKSVSMGADATLKLPRTYTRTPGGTDAARQQASAEALSR